MKRLWMVLLCLLLVCGMAAAEEFTGTASGFGGPVTVTVTVEDGRLTECVIDASGETEGIGKAAAETLQQAIVESQGKVDAITGATATSQAVQAALQQALTAAGLNEEEQSVMLPGTYTGQAHGFSSIDQITVHVTVDEEHILALAMEDTFQKDRDSYENPYMAKGAFQLLQGRITQAQSIGVDSITGATGSSTGIKNAIRNALQQAYQANGLDEVQAMHAVNAHFMAQPEKQTAYVEMDTDVIVVGAGASGAIASLTALKEGVSVINIEKTFRWGGQSMLTGGPKVFSGRTDEATMDATVVEYEGVTADSRFGTDAIWNDADYQQAHADEFVDFNHAAYRAVIPASGEGAKTLMEAGVMFAEGLDFAAMGEMLEGMPGLPPIPGAGAGEGAAAGLPALPEGIGLPPMGAMSIEDLMSMPMDPIDIADIDGYVTGQNLSYMDAEDGYDKVYRAFVEQGGTALLETRATDLLYDAQGEIIGVEALGDDGTQYRITAKAVILATGGFGGNDDMVEQYTPGGKDWIYYGWQGNDGDGINMAFDAGAKGINMDAYPMSHQRMGAEFVTAFDVQLTEYGQIWSPNDLPVVLAVHPDGVYLTRDGMPFFSESIHSKMGGFSSSMGSYYLGSRYYVVYSASQLEDYAAHGMMDTTMGFQNTGEGIPAGYPLGTWVDTVLDHAVSRGWAWKIASLEEGDDVLGWEHGTLAKAYAADSTQLNHADDAYYYVIACTGLSISSCGGIEVNEKMQAVKTDGTSTIQNLFVIGNDSFGNIMATGAEYSIGGDAGMWCFGSGEIAGIEAAAYCK